jgi:hypothetical protein
MIITEEVIPLIEKALGFELYDHQKDYILKKGSLKPGRATGKTKAYCIALALSDGEPLDMRKPWVFSDGWELRDRDRKHYAMSFFRREFLDIWDRLKRCGFPVRQIRRMK